MSLIFSLVLVATLGAAGAAILMMACRSLSGTTLVAPARWAHASWSLLVVAD
jgi:hypothetical protein